MNVQAFQKGWGVLVALFLLAALWLVVFPIKDYDTFWHLANGKAMLEQGRILNEEIFSYSAFGTPFWNHSWLAQIVMALFYQAGELNGLLAFKLLLTASVFLVVYRIACQLDVSPVLAGLAGYGVVLVGLSRFVVRPQLFSYVFLAILFLALNGYLRRRWRWQVLAVLPLLIVTWEFMHGAIFGFVLWGALATGETIKLLLKGRLQRWQEPFIVCRGQVLQLWAWLAVSVLISLLIPGGFERYQSLFVNFWGGSDFIVNMTGEFMPTDWEGIFRPFWLLLGMMILGLLINWRRLDLAHLTLLIPFAYLGLRYNRCVAVFAVVAAPLLVHYIQQFYDTLDPRGVTRKLSQLTILVLCLVSLGWGAQIKGFPLPEGEFDPSGFRTGGGLNNVFLPMGMVEFVKVAGLKGNMYNNDRWGGFLAFYLYPERRIFHYNHPLVFKDIYEYLHRPEERDKWQHNYALIATGDEYNMFRRMNWAVIYRDAVSMVMVPRNEGNRGVIARYEVRYFNPLLPSDKIRQMLKYPVTAKPLAREMLNYLTFNKDSRISGLAAEAGLR